MVNRNLMMETLRKILEQEVASEFNDSTVIGGIEAFLTLNTGMFPERFLEPLEGYSLRCSH